MKVKRKGFTLVEVIVVLVILGILAAVLIPSMKGFIDRAREKRLIAACRSCVIAAQALIAEKYGKDGTKSPPDSDEIIDLAGVKGTILGISMDADSAAINTLTYGEGEETVTYMREPTPHYVVGSLIASETAAAYDWSQSHERSHNAREYLTIDYGDASTPPPSPLSAEQVKSVFGKESPQNGEYYIYPLAIYGTNGKPLNIQYVTQKNPSSGSGYGRYSAAALIIDGKVYVSTSRKTGGKVTARAEAASGTGNRFQSLMNNTDFGSAQEFIDLITSEGFFIEE